MMDKPTERKYVGVAKRVVDAVDEPLKIALSKLMVDLLVIRKQALSPLAKAKAASVTTKKHKVVYSLIKTIGGELKRVGWDDRSVKARLGLGGASFGLLFFGGQGAGIAALGGAVGVPLWVVLGAGATFAGAVIEEVATSQSSKSNDSVAATDRGKGA